MLTQKPLSWSDISLFIECPRCFYLKVKRGVSRPGRPNEAFALYKAVDKLCKKDADFNRLAKQSLRIFEKNKIDVIPYEAKYVNEWRKPYYYGGGLTFYHKELDLHLTGSIDDVFINPENKLTVVEFKATKLNKKSKWYIRSELQVIFYSWLLMKNGESVNDNGYLIYSDPHETQINFYPFNNTMYFRTSLSACKIDYSRIERVLKDISLCLTNENMPKQGGSRCGFCGYANNLFNKLGLERLAVSSA